MSSIDLYISEAKMNISEQTYPFPFLPLPYPYNSLEPYISEETLHYHHDKHLKTYVDNLNKIFQDYPLYHSLTLEEILMNIDLLPGPIQLEVRNNAGGVYNHDLYFNSLKPNPMPPKKVDSNEVQIAYPGEVISLPVLTKIIETFDSFYTFKDLMKTAALRQFGSGYAWLVLTPTNELAIVQTNNQDTPLAFSLIPLLLIDVWEHAYYLDQKNNRGAYIENIFHVINWDAVNYRYLNALESITP